MFPENVHNMDDSPTLQKLHPNSVFFQAWWTTSVGAHLAVITFVRFEP